MARTHDTLDDNLREWIAAQHVFFVASAPTDTDGHVNLSPKGYDSFRVLDDSTVAYLDLTGSGVETIAHLNDNGRLTFMFCGFEGPPRILRLFGRGEVVRPGNTDFESLVGLFPPLPGVRSVIRCEIERIQRADRPRPHLRRACSETMAWQRRCSSEESRSSHPSPSSSRSATQTWASPLPSVNRR